ncbi:hypothetical protein JTB14_012546 [Gonioctena quinquepunctata]|nr:hypothetical protein JTB14_012546 [Gonioctena quinquepunctata]
MGISEWHKTWLKSLSGGGKKLFLVVMESNSVSPMPELAPIAEFDKTPPTPPEDTLPMDDLPPPPTTVTVQEEKEKEAQEE